jgi:hypothetical protein
VGGAPPPTSAPPSRTTAPVVAPVQASSLGPRCLGSVVLSRSAPAKLGQLDVPRPLRSDLVESFGFPLSQYGSNLDLSGLESPPLSFEPRPLSQSPGGGEEDSSSVGMEVVPPSSPRSPGAVFYTWSPGSTPSSPHGPTTPAPASLAPVSVVPDTPGTGTGARGPRRARQSAQPAQPPRYSTRLARSRAGGVLEPTVFEQASRQAAARNLDPGTPSSDLPSPPSGSRFSILHSVPVDDLDVVASDCIIIFRGERGPRLEQIAALKAKEMYEGALAASRAQAERERAGAPEPTGPVQEAPGSSNGGAPLPSSEAGPSGTPRWGGGTRGRPPLAPSRPSTRGRDRSVPSRGTSPNVGSQ